MGLKNLLSNLVIRRPSFIVAGKEFDTAEVLKGRKRLRYDRERDDTSCIELTDPPLNFRKLPAIAFEQQEEVLTTVRKAYPAFYQDFTQLMSSTSLTSPARLGITNYHAPAASAGYRFIHLDSLLFKILEPPWIEAVLGHELTHIELEDRRIHIDTFRDEEFAADKGAAEITKAPLALASALERMTEFDQAFRSAVPALRWRAGVSYARNVLESILLLDNPKNSIHPSLAERVARLETYAERIEKGAVKVLENGRIRL